MVFSDAYAMVEAGGRLIREDHPHHNCDLQYLTLAKPAELKGYEVPPGMVVVKDETRCGVYWLVSAERYSEYQS
jgi:hypothetical protein